MKSEKIITHAEITINPKFLQEILPKAKETREKILLEQGCETFILTTKKKMKTHWLFLQFILLNKLMLGIWNRIMLKVSSAF
ncbi:hypothetical protein [Chryseobacterium sp. 3008163]|uniref:hypothetical protein n=1 Tax=Chryseobacterium sp. 3008163 TaxID=2478663 RepID=UPI000F0D05D4|nr:hypothetical protein [Chryseobacterium sp. 3008163]AYM99688.1 hypothetical protein EAG08_04465 [Chryseobacterium sp. 3008163]